MSLSLREFRPRCDRLCAKRIYLIPPFGRHIHSPFSIFNSQFANSPIIRNAARIPSTAADIMPPAYPAPSPHGMMPLQPSPNRSSPRVMRTGDEVRVSGPVSSASAVS